MKVKQISSSSSILRKKSGFDSNIYTKLHFFYHLSNYIPSSNGWMLRFEILKFANKSLRIIVLLFLRYDLASLLECQDLKFANSHTWNVSRKIFLKSNIQDALKFQKTCTMKVRNTLPMQELWLFLKQYMLEKLYYNSPTGTRQVICTIGYSVVIAVQANWDRCSFSFTSHPKLWPYSKALPICHPECVTDGNC